MVKEDFVDFLKKIYNYFEKIEPKFHTIDLWYLEVNKIDGNSLNFIYKHIIQDSAGVPRNLPGAMIALYQEWRKTVGKKDADACGCHEGWWEVVFYYPEKEIWAIYSLRCGNCGSGGPKSIDDLIPLENYEQEPSRWAKEPPPWGMIYPEPKSRKPYIDKILAHLKDRPAKGNLFEGRPTHEDLAKYGPELPQEVLSKITKDHGDLPF
jgi:hypothetical protein